MLSTSKAAYNGKWFEDYEKDALEDYAQ